MTPGGGDLRDAVRVDRRAAADDGYGNTKAGWAPLIRRRLAKMAPLRGGEALIAQRAAGTASFDVWLRYDRLTATIATGDRLVDLRRGDTFNIRWAEDWERRGRWIRLQVERGVGDG